MKKVVVLTLIIALIIGFFPISIFAETEDNTEIFFDDFSSDKLDTSKWLVANKAWGGNNGGVVPENVSISDGILKLEGHGDLYEGDVEGYNKPDGKRTGAAIATREYFGSGSYEVVAKVAPELGACSAIWTFEYEEYYPGDTKYEELAPENAPYYAVNHEIDIEMPGRPSNNSKPSYEYALCNTWRGERGGEYTTGYTKLPKAQNDGEFHKYRFDWHTGDEGETPRVDFYFDDELITTNTTHIPTNEGRLWIGLWFPNGWAGTPDFDTAVFEIDSVKITPFHEAGDTEQNETYSEGGWAEDTFFDDPTIKPDPIDEPLSFTFDLSYEEEIAAPGDTINVIGKISEIQKNSSNGLLALGGVLEYDKNVLELQDIKGLNDWKMSLQDYNPENGKWVTVANSYVETAGDVFELTFKVKEDLENTETEVKLTNIEGGTAQDKNGVVYSDDTKEIITIRTEEKYILGDVNCDGDITINDLAQMKLHIVEIINLEGVRFKAGDLDKDGDIDVNDLAKMKLYLIELITEF